MRPATKTQKFVILYFLFSILVLFLDSRGFLRPLQRLVQIVSIPVRSRLYESRQEILGKLGGLGRLGEDTDRKIRELEEKNAQVSAQLARIGSLEAENAHLKELVGSSLPGTWSYEPVRVVGGGVDALETLGPHFTEASPGEITIATKQDAKSGIFVGRIEKVNGRLGEVFLPTRAGTKITVTVKSADTGEKHASGVLEGRGEGSILDQVLTREILKEGDLIVTSGDENTPPDLLVGYVGKVLPVKNASFQQAEVVAPIDYGKLEEVFVITKF